MKSIQLLELFIENIHKISIFHYLFFLFSQSFDTNYVNHPVVQNFFINVHSILSSFISYVCETFIATIRTCHVSFILRVSHFLFQTQIIIDCFIYRYHQILLRQLKHQLSINVKFQQHFHHLQD